MNRFGARRVVAVGVEQAQAFVDTMRDIAGYTSLRDGWAGDGSLRTRAPAANAARRLLETRQLAANRFRAAPSPDGGVTLRFEAGADGGGPPGHVHIDVTGSPAILEGEPLGLPVVTRRYPGISDKAFRKALDDLVSPRTGRIKSRKVEIDGITFDSDIEGRRYSMLKGEVALGRITDLRLQVPYVFEEGGVRCFTYIADFVYVENGVETVEDVKGMRTDVYRLKKKLIEARHGFVIQEWPVSAKEQKRRDAAAERARLAAERAERQAERARLAAERAGERQSRRAGRATRSG